MRVVASDLHKGEIKGCCGVPVLLRVDAVRREMADMADMVGSYITGERPPTTSLSPTTIRSRNGAV